MTARLGTAGNMVDVGKLLFPVFRAIPSRSPHNKLFCSCHSILGFCACIRGYNYVSCQPPGLPYLAPDTNLLICKAALVWIVVTFGNDNRLIIFECVKRIKWRFGIRCNCRDCPSIIVFIHPLCLCWT